MRLCRERICRERSNCVVVVFCFLQNDHFEFELLATAFLESFLLPCGSFLKVSLLAATWILPLLESFRTIFFGYSKISNHFSICMDPQLVQAIAQAVLQQLRSTDSRPPAQAAPSLNATLLQHLQNNTSQQPSRFLTPELNSNLSRSSSGISDSNLSRSSSGISDTSTLSRRSLSGFSTSSESLASTPSSTTSSSSKKRRALDFSEFEKKAAKKRRKRRSDPELNAIVDTITRPIMEDMDSQFLSLPESKLFQRQMKKIRNPDGTRSLRKNKTMVMPLFRKLVRPIIRRLLGRLETPNASQIYSKYYRAAIKIVTKRRANHVQSWRLYNRPAKLCYDTLKPGQRHRQQVEDESRLQDVEHEPQQQDEDESQQQEVEDESQQQEVEDESQKQDVEDESQKQDVEDKSQQMDIEHESQQQEVEDESQKQDVEDESQKQDGRDAFCCLDCKKSFPRKESFPPDENIWRMNSITSFRCKSCYKKYMNEKVVPLLMDGKEKENLNRALTSPTSKRKKKSSARKRRTIVKCKWCGSKSHKTKRSKKCPYFGSTDDSPPVAKVDDAPPAAKADDAPPVAKADDAPPTTESDDTPPVAEICDSRPLFNIGDTVLAMWSRRQWFLAHITGIKGGKYNLYFPDDAKVKSGVDPQRVKACPVSRGLPVRKRGDMINKVFYDDGIGKTDRIPDGMWLVRMIKGNEYVCVRSPDCRNKDSSPNCSNFDIGYVMRTIEQSEQNIRNEF